MRGCADDDGFEFISLCNEVKTIVLVGRTGNGKSSTGNSIIGRRVFDSRPSSAGVSTTCHLQRTVLEDGQILNVIDTSGFFDSSAEPELVSKKFARCINMAKNGIHAVLLVLSLRYCFSREEAGTVETLREFFGWKIGDYMIVVFMGGDGLGNNSLDDYLRCHCPEYLEAKKPAQVKELVSFVNTVVDNNGGIPYTNELFAELKVKMGEVELHDQIAELGSSEISKFEKQFSKSFEVQLKGFAETIKLGLRESIQGLHKQFAKEHSARVEAETTAQAALAKSNDWILELTECLERARKETEALHKTRKNKEKKHHDQTTELGSSEKSEFEKQSSKSYEVQLNVETSRLRESILSLEKQLGNEHAARVESETRAEAALAESNDRIRELTERLEIACKETEGLQKRHKKTEKKASKGKKKLSKGS